MILACDTRESRCKAAVLSAAADAMVYMSSILLRLHLFH